MKNLFALGFICFMLNLAVSNKHKNDLAHIYMKADKSYTYIDGNNNKYVIAKLKTGSCIEYFPISAKESSSGTYDGGKPYKISITESDYKSITDLLNKSTKDDSQLNIERNMGSGTIILPKNKVFFLKMDSYNKTIIEKKLQELKLTYLNAKTTSLGDTLVIEGKIVEKSFESKRGTMTDIKEFFFEPSANAITNQGLVKEYFVKLSKGKMKRDLVQTLIGKSLHFELIVMRGLWDADDNTHQSRFGDYVILLKVVD